MVLGVIKVPPGATQVLQLAEEARAIVRAASRLVLEIYNRPPSELDVRNKADGTPVTAADMAAHNTLVEGLAAISQRLPVISEEDDSHTSSLVAGEPFWLTDPLDGTKEFLARNGEFTVNLALIIGSRPVWGAVAVPVNGRLYEGGRGLGSRLWRDMLPTDIHTVAASTRQCRALVSRSHLGPSTTKILQRLESHFEQVVQIPRGSSLKLCDIAEGEGDLYPRVGPIHQWDLAAGQAVLEGAGGQLLHLDGQPLVYGNDFSVKVPATLAFGDPSLDWRKKIAG